MGPLEAFFRHNRWANVTIIDFLLGLDESKLMQKSPGAVYPPHNCMVHVLFNEEGYYQGVTGTKLDVPPWVPGQPPSLAAMHHRFDNIGNLWATVAKDAEPDRIVTTEWRGEEVRIPLPVFLVQVVNHGAEHREQVKASLLVAGVEGPPLDSWTWQAAGMP